ncbi:MAG: ribosome maturation factor RimP [Oscillospiraceae bacterium]|nr:ribosome maturation factor RimP [Oscillospiraceae bacterium]
MSKKIIDAVSALALTVLPGLGLELWDAEFTKEGGAYFLRLYIDKPDGVSLDDCEAVSRMVDPLLDEREDIFPDAGYTFEVSSAGLERKLRRPSDYVRFQGRLAEVRLYKARYGARSHIGTLAGYDAERGLALRVENGELIFKDNEIASARLRIE